MRNVTIAWASAALAVLLANGCGGKDSPTAPTSHDISASAPTVGGDTATTSGTDASATAAPVISGIAGVTSSASGVSNGLVSMASYPPVCGTAYDGGRAVNDLPGAYHWTISGSNFGSAPGSVRVGGVPATITSWSSSKIVAYPVTARYDVGAMSTTLEVTTAANLTVRTTASVVPAIRTRIFGQCTWWVALKRLRLGRQPSPTAYGGYSNFTALYVPAVGDQLQWLGRHTAIITQVSGPVVTGTQRKWTVTIEEYNASCTNNYNIYSDTYAVANGQIVDGLRSSVTSYGNASSFYR